MHLALYALKSSVHPIKPNTMEIGTKIRKLRELKDYTQAYMAESLNISQSQYARIENNQVDISFTRLQQVAKLLDVELKQLLSLDVLQYFNQVSHSQIGSGQYIDQRGNAQDDLRAQMMAM